MVGYNGTYYWVDYDEIGNPIRYGYGESDSDYMEDGYELTWDGRELVAFRGCSDFDALTYYSTITYTYNADGIRTSKTVNGVKHEYYLSGSQIIAEVWVENDVEHTLIYIYDETGSPIGLKYRNDAYNYDAFDSFFFEKNLQGDIIAVYNESGALIGKYVYDAWGNHSAYALGSTTLENKIVNTYNPFRYRGYYYDVETKFYYLQSRYYNPEWCRFITMDEIDVITATPTGLTDKNLYAYCDNNPITRIDEDGEFWSLIGAAVGAVAGVVGQVVSDVVTSVLSGEVTISNWQTYVGAAVGGAAGGFVLATTGSVNAANVVSGAVSTGVGQSLEKLTISDYDKSWGEIATNMVVDGVVSYGMGKLPGIKGITAGRNSWSAVYQSGLTKLRNQTATRMSLKVMAKGLGSNIVDSFVSSIYGATKQYNYNWPKNVLSQQ